MPADELPRIEAPTANGGSTPARRPLHRSAEFGGRRLRPSESSARTERRPGDPTRRPRPLAGSSTGVRVVVGILIIVAFVACLGGAVTAPTSSTGSSAARFTLLTTGVTATPTDGVVGSTLAVRGTGFAADSTINITFGGFAENSTCSTDVAGTFPGSTGTPCSFPVPMASVGSHLVSATDGTSTGTTAFFVTDPNVTLSPVSGAVGVSMTAAGTGFAPDDTIGFEIVGHAISAVCRTDAAGDFPGTTGTGCRFNMPTAPGGASDVLVTGWNTTARVPVKIEPDGVAYDSATGDVYVTNERLTGTSGVVSVISDSTDQVVANITLGPNPSDAAYDSARSEIFTTTSGSCTFAACTQNTVNVINGTSRTVVKNIGVGYSPIGIAYDSGTGQMFVANYISNNVSVIDDSNDSVVTSVSVGHHPYAVAYDSATGEVFVANTADDNVTVINDTTDAVVANIGVGTYPDGVAYDPGAGELFVADGPDGNLSVINDTNDTVVATIAVGGYPSAVTFDPGDGEILVADQFNASVTVVSGSTNALVTVLPVGDAPESVAYDPGTQQIFVPNSGSDNVSVIDLMDDVATTPFHVTTHSLKLAPAQGSVGTQVTTSGIGFSANDPVTFTFGGTNVSSVCSTDLTGTFPGATGTSCSISVPVVPAGVYSVVASDPRFQGNTTFRVRPDLQLTPSSGDAGRPVVATGTGFAPSASISFTFGGSAVVATCSTDPSGHFPGTTGTPCTFDLPSVPVGKYTVSATDGANTGNASYFVTALTVSPSSGNVGSAVLASGTAPTGNSTVFFTVGGAAVSSNCTTDSNGSYPGSSGTACLFSLPPLPGGSEGVQAFGWSSAPGFNASGDPLGVAYDSGTRQIFVTNGDSGTVSVIDDWDDAVVANIVTGGSLPFGVAYDSGRGEVFVTNYESNSVSVINDTTDRVVDTISVGQGPLGIAYDPGTSELYVADYGNPSIPPFGSNNVTVISDTNNSVVDTVALATVAGVAADPDSDAYDPATGQVFVTAFGSAAVFAINDTTFSALVQVAVAPFPDGVAYDAETGQVLVTSMGTAIGSVNVINETDDLVVATVTTGGDSEGVAVDPATGQWFVPNSNSKSVSVISDVSDAVVETLGAGESPDWIAYDSGTGQLFVPQSVSNNVSVISGLSFGTAAFTVNSTLALDASSSASADIGQSVDIQGTGFGSSQSILTFTLGSVSLNCTRATTGYCIGGALTTSPQGLFGAQFTVPTVPAPGVYRVTVVDGDGHTATARITVTAAPILGAITATRTTLDVGQSTTLGLASSSGSGGLSYAWIGLPTGCTSPGAASFNCTPTVAGNFSLTVQVTDSNGDSVNSTSLGLTVDPDPVATTPIATAPEGESDAGQSVTFTTTESLGSGTYTATTWFGLPNGCVGNTVSVTCSGNDLPAGQYSISVSVTDSSGYSSAPSQALGFRVNPDLTVAGPSASRPSADVGQSVTFSASASSGSAPYSYDWLDLPTGCAGTSASTLVCPTTATGTFAVQLLVMDATGGTVTSGALSFTVESDPTVQLAANRVAFDSGQSLTLTATGAQGSGGYTYDWSGLPLGCDGAGVEIACSPIQSGQFSVEVKLTDSNGASVESAALGLAIASPLAVSLSATPEASSAGQTVTFAANVTGGTGPESYTWAFGDGGTGSGGTTSHVYRSEGNYPVTLWVNDSAGESVETTLTVSVASSNTGGLGSANEILWILAAVVIATVAGVVGALRLSKGGSSEEPTDATPAQESEGTSPEEIMNDGPDDPE
ncbi:MAG: PKD domain-containing protein [Thermoplasmata archaeon]|nr:PKD domain-containing protein [Thermoplasmata archaeon]